MTSSSSPLALVLRFLVSDGSRPGTPYAPDGREERRYLVAALAAALPCIAVATHTMGSRVLLIAAVACAACATVEIVMALLRKKPVGGGAFTFALLIALIVPPTMPLWTVALCSALGTLFGKEVFGGTGHHIFSPVYVVKGFLLFSFPTLATGSYFGSMFDPASPRPWQMASIAIAVGALFMLVARPKNALIIIGILGSAFLAAWGLSLGKHLPKPFTAPWQLLVSNGVLMGACLLACDPASSPRRIPAMLIYAVLIGPLAILVRVFSNITEGMVAAVLFANVLAPLLDAATSRTERT